MQENEFEREIRKQMAGFKLAPDPGLWNTISSEINNKRKRRRAIIYWLSAAALLLIFPGSWLIIRNAKNAHDLAERKEQKTVVDLHRKAPPPAGMNSLPAEKNKDLKAGQRSRTDVNAAAPLPLRTSVLPGLVKMPQGNTKSPASPINERAAILQGGMELSKNLAVKAHQQVFAVNTGELPMHKFYQPNAEATPSKNLAGQQNRSSKKNYVREDTAGLQRQQQKGAARAVAWKPGLSIHLGASDNIAGLTSSSDKNYADAPPASSISNGGFAAYLPALQYNSNLSFGIGLSLSKQLTKRLSVSAGAGYHYYSSSSTVGNIITGMGSNRTFFDSALNATSNVSRYYVFGTSNRFTNTYHVFEIPVSLNLRLNANSNKPLLLFVGVVPGYLAGSKALYANRNMRIYYPESGQFKHFQLSTNIGLSLPVYTTPRYVFSVGPQAKYSLTNIGKRATDTNQHLSFLGLTASISLK